MRRPHARRMLLVPVLVALLASCGPPNERGDLDRTIASAVAEAGDGGTVDMGAVTDLDWDTMFAFGGYTTDDEVSEAIGVPWGSGDDSRVPYDGRGLVLFMNDRTVVAWTKLNAGAGAGDAAVRFNQTFESIPIEKARFRVSLDDETANGGDLFYLTLVN